MSTTYILAELIIYDIMHTDYHDARMREEVFIGRHIVDIYTYTYI